MALSAQSVRFRTKKISIKAPLQVLHENDIPDFDDEISLQRSVPQVETGVEKEEEEEHHLKQAILAQISFTTSDHNARVNSNTTENNLDSTDTDKTNHKPEKLSNGTESSSEPQKQLNKSKSTTSRVYIPTPKTSESAANFNIYYTSNYKPPVTPIKFSTTVEDAIGSFYCIDYEDEQWIKQNRDLFAKKPRSKAAANSAANSSTAGHSLTYPPEIAFENAMFTFETLFEANKSRLTFGDVPLIQTITFEAFSSDITLDNIDVHTAPVLFDNVIPIASQDSNLVSSVFKYWREKKLRYKCRPLMPKLRFEDDSVGDDNNPYICFRRRDFRQTRKSRRSDASTTNKLLKLSEDLTCARQILSLVNKRNKLSLEATMNEFQIFEARQVIKDMKRKLGIKDSDEDLIASPPKRPTIDLIISRTIAKTKASAAAAAAGVSSSSSGANAAQSLASNSNAMSGTGIITGSASSTGGGLDAQDARRASSPSSALSALNYVDENECLYKSEQFIDDKRRKLDKQVAAYASTLPISKQSMVMIFSPYRQSPISYSDTFFRAVDWKSPLSANYLSSSTPSSSDQPQNTMYPFAMHPQPSAAHDTITVIRRRCGRNGRIMLDRQLLRSEDILVNHNSPDDDEYNAWKYDPSSTMLPQLYPIDEFRDDLVKLRASLLTNKNHY